jgi:glycosyltransferase involved in cell wall biosynthesis
MLIGKEKYHQAPSVLVLLAALDEEKGIQRTLAELKYYVPDSKFLVVDGNSIDGTVHAAKTQGADVIFQKGKGKGDAISYGLESVYTDFDYVILTDADYTYPAKYIPQMIEIMEADPEIGMVCGNRFNSHLDFGSMRYFLYFGNRVIASVHNLLNGVALQDPLTGLRVVRWNIVRKWRPKSAGFDVEVELNHHVERSGYKIAEVEVPYRQRIGEKKLKIWHGATILRRILSESVY